MSKRAASSLARRMMRLAVAPLDPALRAEDPLREPIDASLRRGGEGRSALGDDELPPREAERHADLALLAVADLLDRDVEPRVGVSVREAVEVRDHEVEPVLIQARRPVSVRLDLDSQHALLLVLESEEELGSSDVPEAGDGPARRVQYTRRGTSRRTAPVKVMFRSSGYS